MKKWLKIVAVVVICSFLYENVVWAGGLPSETLSPDAKGIIADIIKRVGVQGEAGDRFRAFLQVRGTSTPREIFELVVGGVMRAGEDEGLLEVYREILFAVFGEYLTAIEKDEVVLEMNNYYSLRLFNKRTRERYLLTYEDGELNVHKIPEASDETAEGSPSLGLLKGPKGVHGFARVVIQVIITVITILAAAIIFLCSACKAKDEPPPHAPPDNQIHTLAPGEQPPVEGPQLASGPPDDDRRVETPPVLVSLDSDVSDLITRFDRWIKRISQTRTGLPPSHVGDKREVAKQHGFSAGGFTYDLAQLALRYVRAGQFTEARKIIEYFAERFNQHSVSEINKLIDSGNNEMDKITRVHGILRLLKSPADDVVRKHFINCIDTSSSWDTGNGIIEWYTDGGPMSWLGMAAVQLLIADNSLGGQDRIKLEKFVRELSETITGLFHDENVIAAGPAGQDIDGAPKREHLGHIENMWDHYAFLMQVGQYWQSKDVRFAADCRSKAASILQKLKRLNAFVRDGDEAYFYQGFKNGRLNPQIPTDVQSWGILAVGPEKLDEVFGEGTAEGMVNWLIGHVLVLTDYERPDGYRITTIGADFSDPYLPDMKSARGGVKAQITDEWTSGVILAIYKTAGYLQGKGQNDKAQKLVAIADALRFFALQRAVRTKDGMMYWEYSTEPDMPTGYGWNTPDANDGSLAGNQMLLALMGVNPFNPSENIKDLISGIQRLGVNKGIEILLKEMGNRYKFSRNPVIMPGETPPESGKGVQMSWGKTTAGRQGGDMLLMDPSRLKKISYFSHIGEGVGKISAEAGVIGVRTATIWNSAEVSFKDDVNISSTPFLRVFIKAGNGASSVRINVVDRAYLDAQNWKVPPPFVDINVAGDDKWHGVVVDLRKSGADITKVVAIGFEVGTETAGNPLGTLFYFRDAVFTDSGKTTGQVTPEEVSEPGPVTPERKPAPTAEREGETVSGGEVIANRGSPWGGANDFAYYLDIHRSFSHGDTLRFHVPTQFAGQSVIVQLLPQSMSPGDYVNTVTKVVPKNGILDIRVSEFSEGNNIKQISFHAGMNPWGKRLGSGMIKWTKVELIRKTGPKAWVGNELDVGEIGIKIAELEEKKLVDLDKISDESSGDEARFVYLREPVREDGVSIDVNSERPYITVNVPGRYFIVFAIPLPDGRILVPQGLANALIHDGKLTLAGQELLRHETIEGSGVNLTTELNQMYAGLPSEDDKAYLVTLLKKAGIRVVIQEGTIMRYEMLTSYATDNVRHIVGEVSELHLEYTSSGKRYKKFSEVSISSLDAFLLAEVLEQELGQDSKIDKEKFVKAVTAPDSETKDIIVGMVETSRLSVEVINRAYNAVEKAGDAIETYPSGDLPLTTKATLVLADRWSWRDIQIGTLQDILGDQYDVLNKGLIDNGYETFIPSIQEMLIKARFELGKSASSAKGENRIKVSNPYVHAVLLKVAQIAGMHPQDLLDAFYRDVITGNVNRDRIIHVCVENALVEAQTVHKKGLLSYEKTVSPSFAKAVRALAIAVYTGKISSNAELCDIADMAMAVSAKSDVFGIIEDMLVQAPFTGKLTCTKGASAGINSLLELLNLDCTAQRHAFVLPDGTELRLEGGTMYVSVDHLFAVTSIDVESKTLILQPKAVGIQGGIKGMLASGIEVVITARPEMLSEMFSGLPEDARQEVLQDAIRKYLGIGNIRLAVGNAQSIIARLRNLKNIRMIMTNSDVDGLQANQNRGVFIYVPQAGEMLGNVITVAGAVRLKYDGALTAASKEIIQSYLKHQVPGIAGIEIWGDVVLALDRYRNTANTFFALPLIPALAERIMEFEIFRITVLVAA